MPKQSSRAQHPSSPGSVGAASVDEKRNANFPSSEGATAEPRDDTVVAPHAGTLNGSPNGHGVKADPCDCWPRELDQFLRDAATANANHESASIAFIHQAHPGLSKTLIWERIVYLGLTSRKRPPYDAHEWRDVEDEILRSEYGSGRTGAHAATEKILALHPDWSHDAVARRAQVLGVTNHRAGPTQRWNQQLDDALRELADCKLETIARRLGRSHKSILARIRRLGFDAGFFGGHKTKDLVRYLCVSEAQVNAWVQTGCLERKRGRITDDSLARFCREHAELIPFENLAAEAQNWVCSLGYKKPARPENGIEGDSN